MRIAIFGGCAVGKTETARLLAGEVKVPSRHCGEEVKQLAKSRGVGAAVLEDDDLWRIDDETRRLVSDTSPLIVEGRYLDCVLHDVEAVLLIELVCNISERTFRAGLAGRGVVLAEEDAHDLRLRRRLYKGRGRNPDLVIDTSLISASAVVAKILEARP